MENIDEYELINKIKNNINNIEDRINEACKKAGRSRDEITLIGVSKVFPVQYAMAAIKAGLTDLGENRVQELVPKYETVKEAGLDCNWHLIGSLQKNKVKYIIGKPKLIHSVDSVDLAKEINKRSAANNIVTNILLETNVSGEESKHGFSPSEIKEALSEIDSMENVKVNGLMTMAPIQQYDGQAREVFANTKKLFDELKGEVKDEKARNMLSMGMSQDFEYAILEGSTCIRIGTSIFGDRRYIDSH